MPEQRKFAVAAAYLTLCVIWSSTWLAIKIGLRDLPPISFVAIRFAIAVVILLAISMGRVRLLPWRRSDLKLLAYTGVLMFAVNYVLLFWAELYVSSGLTAVLQATIPIFGMVFAHYLLPGEPLRWQRVAGALLAIGGVALVCSRLLDFGGVLAFWGGVAVVFGAAGAAFSNVLLKKRDLQLAPAMIAAWQMIFGVVPLLVLDLSSTGIRSTSLTKRRCSDSFIWRCGVRADISASLLAAAADVGPNRQTISLITPPAPCVWVAARGRLFTLVTRRRALVLEACG